MRACGDCQLCCKLLPVPPLGKKAGERCKHQRHHKGCAVYHTAAMPAACGLWNCRWLVNDDAAELPRPDRAHYVLDIAPDFVTVVNNEDGSKQHIQVAQIWVDPRHAGAWRVPELLAWIERRAAEGIAAIVRFNETNAIVVFAPALASDGQWHEMGSAMREQSHSGAEIAAALGGTLKITFAEK